VAPLAALWVMALALPAGEEMVHTVPDGLEVTGHPLLECARLTFGSTEQALVVAAYSDGKGKLLAVLAATPEGTPVDLLCPGDGGGMHLLFPQKRPVGRSWGTVPKAGFRLQAWCAGGPGGGHGSCALQRARVYDAPPVKLAPAPVTPPPPPAPRITVPGYRVEAVRPAEEALQDVVFSTVQRRLQYCAHLKQPAGGPRTLVVDVLEDRLGTSIVGAHIQPSHPGVDACLASFNHRGVGTRKRTYAVRVTPDPEVPLGSFNRWTMDITSVKLGVASVETVQPFAVDVIQALAVCTQHRMYGYETFHVRLRISMDGNGGPHAVLKSVAVDEADAALRPALECAARGTRVAPPGVDTVGDVWATLRVSPLVDE